MRRAYLPYVIAAVVLAVAASFVALSYLAPHRGLIVLGVVATKLFHLFLFAVFWFTVYAAGRGLERLVMGRRAWPPEVAVAAGVVGTVAFTFALGATHVIYEWPFRFIVILGAATGVYFLRGELAAVPRRLRRWLDELGVASAVVLCSTAALIAPVVLVAAAPPVYWDALTYHIAVPVAYARAHGFVYLPYNVYASMPMAGGLFFLAAYLWDGLVAANACHLVISLCVLGCTYRLARRYVSQFYAALAAACVALTPVFYGGLGGAHVDHFQILFVAAALYIYLTATEELTRTLRPFVAVGVFLGSCCAVKYTGYAALVGLAAVAAVDLVRKKLNWRGVVVAGVAAAATVAPWLIKAYVERGNPVFPAAYEYFGGRDFSAEQARRVVRWQHEMGEGRRWLDYVAVPYRISVTADETYRSFAGNYLPFVLPLAALSLVLCRRTARLVAFGWVCLAAWAAGPQQLRFLGPALPAFAVGAAASLGAADGRWSRVASRVWRGLLTVATPAVALAYIAGAITIALIPPVYAFGAPFDYYVAAKQPFIHAQQFINEELPPDAKILMVFTNHTLYLQRPAVYDSFLEASALFIAAEKAQDEAGLYRVVRGWGVTHVHLYRYEYQNEVWRYYAPGARWNFYRFLDRYGVPVYEDRWNVVYELTGAER